MIGASFSFWKREFNAWSDKATIYALEPTEKRALKRWRKWRRKLQAIKFLSWNCARCGYGDHIAALQFHHKDPATKTSKHKSIFGSGYGLQRELSEEDYVELRTCELICAYCHAIEGFGNENIEFSVECNV